MKRQMMSAYRKMFTEKKKNNYKTARDRINWLETKIVQSIKNVVYIMYGGKQILYVLKESFYVFYKLMVL